MTPKWVTAQTGVAVVATAVSLAAAFFSWKQLEISREHNRLSLQPALQLAPYAEGPGGRNGLYLSNEGIGPARLTGFEVRAGQHVFPKLGQDQWKEALAAVGVEPSCFASGWPQPATVLRVGFERELLRLTRAERSDPCYMELIKLIGGQGVDVVIDYESMYEDRQQLEGTSRANKPSLSEWAAAISQAR